jgi:hypothetical protein
MPSLFSVQGSATVPELPDLSSVLIETDRLIVRPPRPGDGAAHYRAVRDSLPNLRRWPASLRWAQEEPSEEGSEGYCQWASGKFQAGRDFALLLVHRETGEMVGASGLHDPDWSVSAFEIGWWGRTGYLGQGLITEGAKAVLDWGFGTLRARRIYAAVDEENTASWRICERIGMECEGRLRHARANPDGQLRTNRLYAAIR